MTVRNPKTIIEEGVMSVGQWLAVLITMGLNSLDGFDVLSISFASPGLTKDWGIDKATLGWVLAMELLGMALGSIVLGGVADKIGRRRTILGCLVLMTVGMYGAGHATGVMDLLPWRLVTGLGIGGTLASINAAAAEVSSRRHRTLAMALMVIGYPVGGVIGGLVVQRLLATSTWHEIFTFGTWATAVFIPLVWFLVPESVAFLDRRRPAGALEQINRILTRFGHETVSALSDGPEDTAKASVMDILKPGLVGVTLLITVAYFAHITSFYFILKWVPKIVVDMGFAPKQAAGMLTWVSLGGAIGGALFGVFAARVGLRQLTIWVLLGGSALVAAFGFAPHDLDTIALIVGAAGFFTNAAIVGLYMLFAEVFPTHVRATGTGFAIGVGRGGSALAPIIAGYLFKAGFALPVVAGTMALGSLMAALCLMGLKYRRAL